MSEDYHIPVMLRETIDFLMTRRDGVYADGTLGGGGHTAAILANLRGEGRLYAFDADPGAIANAQLRFPDGAGGRLIIRQAYFREACEFLQESGISLSGVLLDLGVSSRQLDSDQIGLSYRQEMPLDMRFGPDSGREPASDLIRRLSAEDLATLLRKWGEEPAAWKIAQTIANRRVSHPIVTTTGLREAIESVIPQPFLMPTLSRVFQALRIAVNDEMGELEEALDAYTALLEQGGRLVVLTYHSLEDRIVKEKFRDEERYCVCPPEFPVCRCEKVQRLRILTRKPAIPTPEEIDRNPRARSAKLRVAERVPDRKQARE